MLKGMMKYNMKLYTDAENEQEMKHWTAWHQGPKKKKKAC